MGTREMIRIRSAQPPDADAWLRLRLALWPSEPSAELRHEIDQFFAGRLHDVKAAFLAEAEPGQIVGFAELNIRAYAEGCSTDKVAYLEAWYMEPAYRGKGIGAAMIEAAEQWALENSCTEFASDTLHDNDIGRRAHLAVGFEEVEVIRCFRKQLGKIRPRWASLM